MAGISINLAGDFSALDDLRTRAAATAASVKDAFGSNIGKALFGGIAVAGAAAFAGVVAGVKSAIDAGGELNDMMARTGAAGEGLVVMQRAFENAGMAASQVPAALNKMQKALAGVNEEGEPTATVFGKLGLSIAELTALDPVAAFQKIQESISSIADPATRTAMAMQVFGKSGGEMLAVMTDATAFEQAAEQVGALGKTLSDNAAALDAVGDAFGSLDTKLQQIGVQVAVALLPQLTELGDWMSKTDFSAVGTGIGAIAASVTSLGDALAWVADNSGLQAFANATIGLESTRTALKMDDEKQVFKVPTEAEWQKNAAAGRQRRRASALGAADEIFGAILPKFDPKAAASEEAAAEKAKKEAAAQQGSRAAAGEEYNLEMKILAARLSGDTAAIDAAERRKQIQVEILRLTRAGFDPDAARRPATQKVDAEREAKATEEIRHDIQGQLKEVQSKQFGLKFESTLGAVASMQRIGGGGGATSSGLDYQRQAADLQREGNDLIRQLIALNRPLMDD